MGGEGLGGVFRHHCISGEAQLPDTFTRLYHYVLVEQVTASSKIFCLISALYVIVGYLSSLLVGKNHGLPLFCTSSCSLALSYLILSLEAVLPVMLCQLEFHSPWQWLCPDMHMGLLLP